MIKIKTFVFNPFQENTFVVSEDSGECLIIDPGCYSQHEKNQLIDFIESENLKPVKVINTHCHVDHILGNAFTKEHFSIPLVIHKLERPLLNHTVEQGLFYGLDVDKSPDPDEYIDEGDSIGLGDSFMQIIHVPGHSPGGIALYDKHQQILFSGDILFKGSIGRSDLPGGNYDTLIDGIKRKLLVLDPDTIVYPGHGPHTTIGDEKNLNPFLS